MASAKKKLIPLSELAAMVFGQSDQLLNFKVNERL